MYWMMKLFWLSGICSWCLRTPPAPQEVTGRGVNDERAGRRVDQQQEVSDRYKHDWVWRKSQHAFYYGRHSLSNDWSHRRQAFLDTFLKYSWLVILSINQFERVGVLQLLMMMMIIIIDLFLLCYIHTTEACTKHYTIITLVNRSVCTQTSFSAP